MNRLQSYYEQLQFPIKLLFVGSIFIGIGSIFRNPYLTSIFILDNPMIITITNIFLYTGGFILTYFALLFVVKLLQYKINEPNIIVTSIVAFMVFTLVMTVLSPTMVQPAIYSPNFKFVLGDKTYEVFKTGIFGLLAVFFWVRFIYGKNTNLKPMSYIYLDRKMGNFLIALFGSVVIGVIFSWIWPFVITGIYDFMSFVASDSTNPMSLFTYGLMERLLTLANLDSILHNGMWLTDLGGSWLSPNNTLYVGDVNIWAAQLAEKSNVLGIGGAGRYSSAYYVLNLFAVPGYLAAIYTITTNTKNRMSNLLIFLGAIVLSLVSGVLFPIEIVMLFTAPALYGFHLFMTSFVYAILSGLNVNLGFTYLGSELFATPGNIIDLLGYVNNSAVFESLKSSIIIMLLVGVIVGFIYFAMVHLYYSKLALDPLNLSNKEEKISDFVEFLGGLKNIDSIDNTPMHVYVVVNDRNAISVNGLHRQGVNRIVETKNGFILSYGGGSYTMQKEINKILQNNEVVDTSEQEEE